MFINLTNSKIFHIFIAIVVAIFTTGFLRLQVITGLPDPDGGLYTYVTQYIHAYLNDKEGLQGNMPLHLYQLLTYWVYNLEVNQFILLRLIDALIAIIASILLFKVILKESGSLIFTVLVITPLLIMMNNIQYVGYGYMHSIWASYIPFFSALLIWQKTTQDSNLSFYFIGALISFGILLREPFLPFFILSAVAIHLSYGWKHFFKFIIGSALLGLSVLGYILFLQKENFLTLVNSYNTFGGAIEWFIWGNSVLVAKVLKMAAYTFKVNWFIYITAFISIFYICKLYLSDKKTVNINRLFFWIAVAFIPFLEFILKFGLEYHLASCLPGLAGLSAMGWRFLQNKESKLFQKSSLITIGIVGSLVILPKVNEVLNNKIVFPSEAFQWVTAADSFRGENMIKRSNYLITAAQVYGLSREDSTMAVSGYWQPLFPLTGLLPPTYELAYLRGLYLSYNYNENKLMKMIKKYRPTIIVTSMVPWPGEKDIPKIIERTNLYKKITTVPVNTEIQDGYMSGIIYRLKDFK
ncbi:MAG: hypothetical protein CMH24_00255 [Nitrosomonadales bacterium]|nr:hypothetical protein [Nitrosomonadales bacterium]|tara:strand:+ start:1529 stop:3097 length:1569 start_codon:yes stop_codon:yes gene_type:complete